MARGFREKRQRPYAGKAATAKPELRAEEAIPPASPRVWVTLGPGGRFVIPKKLRQAMEIGVGERLSMEVVDGELRARGFKVGLRQAQALFAPYRKPGVSAVDELIAERRREFEMEERELAEDLRRFGRANKRDG
jgi:bifunctional DNA-binding transcriptional regulator/antitoxin component of YhaV-PrlF toxin-antitoxin module